MAETAVEYIKGENYLTWYSDDPKWVNRIRQIADGNAEVQIVNDDGESVLAHCGDISNILFISGRNVLASVPPNIAARTIIASPISMLISPFL